MNEFDDRLEEKIRALESGASLESVLDGLDAQESNLAPLIRLAASVRGLPHPEPSPDLAQARLRQVLNARQSEAQKTTPRRRAAMPAGSPWRRIEWPQLRWAHVPAIAGGLALLLIAFISLLGLGSWAISTRSAQAATLRNVSGQVYVAADSSGSSWQPVSNGARLHSGQRIRTADASGATLAFFDGSRTTLGADADLTLTRVDGGWGKVLHVVLTQNSGEISSSVVPFNGKKSSFIVYTPTGVASVHGTLFDVAVDDNGSSRYAVDRGKVLVTNDSSQVYLVAGQATASLPGKALEAPGYQFSLDGVLQSKAGSGWVVMGVPFFVNADTVIKGDPQIGSLVHVDGRVVADGSWVADNFGPLESTNKADNQFTGVIKDDSGDIWQIGNWNVLVDDGTTLGSGLDVGVPARVTFEALADGRWHALDIQPLSEGETPAVSPAVTVNSQAHPDLEFKPDEIEVTTCAASSSLDLHQIANLYNQGEAPKDEAANVQLGYQVIKGAEYVNSVELNPQGWDTIPAGQGEDFDIHLTLDSSWHDVQAEAQVKVLVFIASESNWPDHQQRARLTYTLQSNCEPSETPEPEVTSEPTFTATPTATPTVTPSVTVTPTVTVTPQPSATPVTNCTGANPQPTGLTLSQRYGVPYEEIMGWFCQGFGFGEIDLAYTLSRQWGIPVDQIFAMKSSGMGWGVIKKNLATLPTPTPGVMDGSQPATPMPPFNNGHGNGNGNGNGNKPPKPPKNK
jgi:hypothetical protein